VGNRGLFSRLKEVFGLARNKFIGKVMVHACACLIAYLIKYLQIDFGGDTIGQCRKGS